MKTKRIYRDGFFGISETERGLVMTNKFEAGTVVCTTNFQSKLGGSWQKTAAAVLSRHVSGDWGDLSDEDKETNEQALKEGNRLLSSYDTDSGVKVWVITEWDRSVTTVLLPEDY